MTRRINKLMYARDITLGLQIFVEETSFLRENTMEEADTYDYEKK